LGVGGEEASGGTELDLKTKAIIRTGHNDVRKEMCLRAASQNKFAENSAKQKTDV